jgi:tyrosine-specific transport protein
MFLALVYHDLIPVLCSYLGGDLQKVRKAIVLGSLAPLLMFSLWDLVALGLIPIDTLTQNGVAIDPLALLLATGGMCFHTSFDNTRSYAFKIG